MLRAFNREKDFDVEICGLFMKKPQAKEQNFSYGANGCGRFYPVYPYSFMAKETPRKLQPWEYEIYNDPVGVMCFLPPKRCKNCDD